jgi:hypothetical protein
MNTRYTLGVREADVLFTYFLVYLIFVKLNNRSLLFGLIFFDPSRNLLSYLSFGHVFTLYRCVFDSSVIVKKF